MSLHYLGKHEPGNCVFSVRHRHVFTHITRGGIINHHSIAYSLSNISAKNYGNRLMWVESIVCNISVVFLRHSVLFSTVVRDTGDVGLLMKIKNCSNVNTITWWCNVLQTSDSLKVNDELRLIEELKVRGVTQEVRLWGLNRTRDRTGVTIPTNITEALHSSTTWVRRNAAAPARHSTALDNHQLLIPSFSTRIHALKQLFSRQDWLAVSPMTSENVIVPS